VVDNRKSDKKLEEAAEKINKAMCENLNRMVGNKHEAKDLVYVMVEAYFRLQGLKLVGDKVYSGKKYIANLEEYGHNGKELTVKIKYQQPLHYVTLDFEVSANEKSKN